jgi:hypothetical protein
MCPQSQEETLRFLGTVYAQRPNLIASTANVQDPIPFELAFMPDPEGDALRPIDPALEKRLSIIGEKGTVIRNNLVKRDHR